jgi:proteic killer suppression protein
MTIQSFKCRDTRALFDGNRVARFRNIETVAMRKLAMLNRIVRVDELKIPPNNRLEALQGSRRGQWSVRINDQWRVCFCLENARAFKAPTWQTPTA